MKEVREFDGIKYYGKNLYLDWEVFYYYYFNYDNDKNLIFLTI